MALKFPNEIDDRQFFSDLSKNNIEILDEYQKLIMSGKYQEASAFLQKASINSYNAETLNFYRDACVSIGGYLIEKCKKKEKYGKPEPEYDATSTNPTVWMSDEDISFIDEWGDQCYKTFAGNRYYLTEDGTKYYKLNNGQKYRMYAGEMYWVNEQGTKYWYDNDGVEYYYSPSMRRYRLSADGIPYWTDQWGDVYYYDSKWSPYYLDYSGEKCYRDSTGCYYWIDAAGKYHINEHYFYFVFMDGKVMRICKDSSGKTYYIDDFGNPYYNEGIRYFFDVDGDKYYYDDEQSIIYYLDENGIKCWKDYDYIGEDEIPTPFFYYYDSEGRKYRIIDGEIVYIDDEEMEETE